MKIQTTVTVNEIIEVEIELPYYCKYEDKFFKVISEKKTIQVTARETYSNICSTQTWLYEKDIARATTILSYEFENAYLNALSNISSTPKAVAA